MYLTKVMSLKPEFFYSLMTLYNNHRSPAHKLNMSLIKKAYKRGRRESLKKLTSCMSDSQSQELQDHSDICFYDQFLHFKLVIVFIVDSREDLICVPKCFWMPGRMSLQELLPILMKFFKTESTNERNTPITITEENIKVLAIEDTMDFKDCSKECLDAEHIQEDQVVKLRCLVEL